MAITTASKIEEHCRLEADPASDVFDYADQAKAKLVELITKDTYDSIESAGSGDDFDNLQRAESYLSLYFAFPFMNLRPTERGGFTKNVGYGEHTEEQLMGQRELAAYRGKIYQMAVSLLDGIREQVPEDPDEFDDADIDCFDAGPVTVG